MGSQDVAPLRRAATALDLFIAHFALSEAMTFRRIAITASAPSQRADKPAI